MIVAAVRAPVGCGGSGRETYGGFSFVSDDYVDQISAVIARDAVNPYAGRMRVVRAGLGPDAPLVGAAALVHRRDLITL